MHLAELTIGIKGAGEMASAVAWRLFMARIPKVFMMETGRPMAVRRGVSFCEAVYEKSQTVEGVEGVLVEDPEGVREAWESGKIPVVVDPDWKIMARFAPDGVVDAILAKRNLGTHLGDAPLVIALGPGFEAGIDAHFVVETQRGHDLGRVIGRGCAAPNTGIPGNIGGFTEERVLRAPAGGILRSTCRIGDNVKRGQPVAEVGGEAVKAALDGVLRGLLRPGTPVKAGGKVGDIDPRGRVEFCFTVSEKARAIAGGVLEAVCRVYNRSGGH